METEVKELLEQAGVPSTEVTTLEVAEVVEHIGDYLSEVTSQVLWLMDAIPGLDNELLDKLEEQLTKDWDDSPIFENVRDHIMAVIDSYHQSRVLKQLDEKFKQLKNLESDYNVLNKDCEILFKKLTKENFNTLDPHKYHSRFVDEAYEYYNYESSR
jgi:hypothetical protein